VYFTGSDNKRVVDTTATFPDKGTYQQIVLELSLDCPDGKCDHWDRFGTIGLVSEKSLDGGTDTVIEIGRFMTPYRVGGKWEIDVTDLRPLLSGQVTLRAFIDTWVGPGSPILVLPIWTMRSLVYGDPAKPIAQSTPLAVPAGSSYAIRTFVTGHGQGNKGNCAEFCSRKHSIAVDSVAHAATIWRTDCPTTAVPNQSGTWQYPRAGWCPGADVKPWTVDVTADLAGKKSATFGYDVEAYENSCRPDAATCAGCSLGTACAYDGGNHTEPYYSVSSVLIAYR
jgi:hypothetical protein